MPVADLPYRIERLAQEGQYAYLARPIIRKTAAVAVPPTEEAVKKTRVKTAPLAVVAASKLRVLRNVTLCDGPSLWELHRSKGETEEYGFYVHLRLFASRDMVLEYLSGPEVASHSLATDTPIPTLKESDVVITLATFGSDEAVEIAWAEYALMLNSRESNTSLENLEELVRRVYGVDDVSAILGETSKRGRKKKIIVSSPKILPVPKESDTIAEEHSSADETTPVAAIVEGQVAPKAVIRKKRVQTTLREQFSLIQNTPSRVIDVSSFGDTMQHQRGRVLDRVKHAARLAQCTSLPDLFPIVSDNVPGFERAMATLGPRYTARVEEFRSRHEQKANGEPH